MYIGDSVGVIVRVVVVENVASVAIVAVTTGPLSEKTRVSSTKMQRSTKKVNNAIIIVISSVERARSDLLFVSMSILFGLCGGWQRAA